MSKGLIFFLLWFMVYWQYFCPFYKNFSHYYIRKWIFNNKDFEIPIFIRNFVAYNIMNHKNRMWILWALRIQEGGRRNPYVHHFVVDINRNLISINRFFCLFYTNKCRFVYVLYFFPQLSVQNYIFSFNLATKKLKLFALFALIGTILSLCYK